MFQFLTSRRHFSDTGIQYASKLSSEVFDLKMKLHLEQQKSEKVYDKYDFLQKSYTKIEKELEESRQRELELKEAIKSLHEALEKQDLVFDDARIINESYQEHYEELQSKIEQYKEDLVIEDTPRTKTIPENLTDSSQAEVESPPAYEIHGLRAEFLASSTPARVHHSLDGARSNSSQTDSDPDSSLLPPRSHGKSTGLRTPVLPELNEDDLLSIYGPQENWSDIESPIKQAPWAPTRTVAEINARTARAAAFFRSSEERLQFVAASIKKTLRGRHGKLNEFDRKEQEEGRFEETHEVYHGKCSSILGSEEDPAKFGRSTAHSTIMFEAPSTSSDHINSSSPSSCNVTYAGLHEMPSSGKPPRSHIYSRYSPSLEDKPQAALPELPSSPPDIWFEQAMSSSPTIFSSRRPRLRRGQAEKGQNGEKDTTQPQSHAWEQHNGYSTTSAESGIDTPPNAEDDNQLLSSPNTTPRHSFISEVATLVARKLGLQQVASARKSPKVVMPNAGDGTSKRVLSGEKNRRSNVRKKPSKVIAGDGDASISFPRATSVAARPQSTARPQPAATRPGTAATGAMGGKRKPWVPAGRRVA
jgi:hypothetical protein